MPRKLDKHYRQEIYGYVEELLGRGLTTDEHDQLRDIIVEYVFSTRNMRAIVRRWFCSHDWVSDKKIESGQKIRVFVKCAKCDRRTTKKLPVHSVRV